MWLFRKKKVVCEFDYDKLAETIVKAQEMPELRKQEENRDLTSKRYLSNHFYIQKGIVAK